MEEFARKLRGFVKQCNQALVPHLRQFLRFLALPYCYFFLVDWRECSASRLQVVRDFLHIFFVLRNFPDNYASCRLFEKDRREWPFYFGSSYNPFQRGKLCKVVQPFEYQVLFEDKEVCQRLCRGADLAIPRACGVLDPARPLPEQVHDLCAGAGGHPLIAKPVTGNSGRGIFLIEDSGEGPRIRQDGRTRDVADFAIKERFLVQEIIEQHPDMARIYPHSVNSLRVLTLLMPDSSPRVISSLIRFGTGRAFIDNWSAGGLAVGVDLESGRLMPAGHDKKGRRYDRHPDSGIVLESFTVPLWDEVRDLALAAQAAFPYYRLLGHDIAVTANGPTLFEINAFPDLVMQEQNSGPLLKDRGVFNAFRDYDLLICEPQKRLHGDTD